MEVLGAEVNKNSTRQTPPPTPQFLPPPLPSRRARPVPAPLINPVWQGLKYCLNVSETELMIISPRYK